MEIKGKIIKVYPIQTGNGKKGNWYKQEFVLEQPGQYPKPICMNLWGEEAINKYDLVEGLTVTAHINLESREYNGRWYTDVRCWKMEWDDQQRRGWQPGGSPGRVQGEALKGTTPTEEEDTSLRTHYEGQGLGTGPLSDDLPF